VLLSSMCIIMIAGIPSVAQNDVYTAPSKQIAKNGFPSEASSILFEYRGSTDELYNGIGRALSEYGYEIKNSDRALGIIQTEYRPLENGWKSKYTFHLTSSSLFITGRVLSPTAIDIQIVNNTVLGGIPIPGFEEMVRLAREFTDGELKFGFYRTGK
jgi:hypothetical protein